MPSWREITCEWCGVTVRKRHRNRFCSRKCRGLAGRRRYDSPFRYRDSSGYIRLEFWCDDRGRYVHEFEHRRIWREANGPIAAGFVIHHINGQKDDNRIENLECQSREEHSREREAGCEHLPGKTQAETVDREPGAPGGSNPRAGAGRENGKESGVKVRNFHPT